MISRTTSTTLAALALPVVLLFAAGCSKEDGPTTPTTMPANVDDYAETLPRWGEYSPVLPSEDAPTGDPIEEVVSSGGRDYTCTTTPYSITATPEDIVTFNPDSEILWLGALLQGDGYVQGIGSLDELPIRQRAPLTISIDLLTADNTATVENPDLGSVGTAIGGLIQRAHDAGHEAGSDIFFEQKEAYSLEQSALSVGLSARYMGGTVATRLDWEQSIEQHTLTAHFIQNMFTTSIVLPQTPGSLFSDAFTSEILQDQIDLGRIGPDNPPVYISNIVWGRVMTLTMTSSHSIEEMKAALDASYETVGANGEGSIATEHLQVLNESSIRVVTVGGDADNALALLRSGSLRDFFAYDAAITTAKPISYTVRSLADNAIAKVSETTSYNLTECTAVPLEPTGKRYRVTLEGVRIKSLGCDVWPDDQAAEVYYSFYVGDIGGLGNPVASRSESNAVNMIDEQYLGLNASSKYCNVYYDGARGKLRVKGDAYDGDVTSGDEHIGSWDVNYYKPQDVPVGDGYYTRSGGGCSIRLYVNIQEVETLYD